MKNLLFLLFHFRLRALFVEKTDDTFVQFFRSVFVGGIATVADFAAAAIFRETLQFADIAANSMGFVIGLAVNFALSCLFVFQKTRYGRLREFVVFALIGLVGLGVNNGIVLLLGAFINLDTPLFAGVAVFYLVKFIATLITLIWNFGARKIILYSGKNRAKI